MSAGWKGDLVTDMHREGPSGHGGRVGSRVSTRQEAPKAVGGEAGSPVPPPAGQRAPSCSPGAPCVALEAAALKPHGLHPISRDAECVPPDLSGTP